MSIGLTLTLALPFLVAQLLLLVRIGQESRCKLELQFPFLR
jgi:hypothetical protein